MILQRSNLISSTTKMNDMMKITPSIYQVTVICKDVRSEYGLFSHAYINKKFLRKDYIRCHQNVYVKPYISQRCIPCIITCFSKNFK